ncbi:hypothetical protein [Halorussus pelagicus]|uniref:hypothetical protein n=1 Tax=Halorussus pelagicus TaxID=2505977 RepID=UPI000FFC5BA8|nr:hypothetical protein [Halorussus pelagicus]
MTSSLSRRSSLRIAAIGSIGVLAGCLAFGGDADESSPADCDDVATPPTPDGTDEIAPKPYPDFPARLSRSNASEFAADYERAYKHNEILERETNLAYLDVGITDASDAERTDDGFVVNVTTEFGWGQRGDSQGETATQVHADSGSKVSYLVGKNVLKRVEADDWEFADPRTTEGTLLGCGPSTTAE